MVSFGTPLTKERLKADRIANIANKSRLTTPSAQQGMGMQRPLQSSIRPAAAIARPQFKPAFQAVAPRAALKSPIAQRYVKRNDVAKNRRFNSMNQAEGGEQDSANNADANSDINVGITARTSLGDQESMIQAPQEQYMDQADQNDPMGAIASIGQSETNLQGARFNRRQNDQAAAQAALGQAGGGSGWMNADGSLNGDALAGLNAEQSANARQIIDIGKKRGLTDQQIQIGLMTAMTESSLVNVGYGDDLQGVRNPDGSLTTSLGLFQQQTSQGWGTREQVMDPNYSINKFYDTLLSSGGGGNPWNMAQNVQRSAFSDGSNYQKNWGQAQQIYQAASTSPIIKQNGAAEWISTNSGKYHDYDGAYGAQCVDLYNFYTTGFAGGDPQMGRVTGAKDIWNNYDPRAYTRVGGNQNPAMGDVVVWGGSWGGGYGHVGVVAGINPDGTLKVLNANATPQGSRGNTVMSNLGRNDLLGYLRPNKLMGR